jgi:hypothetical protein
MHEGMSYLDRGHDGAHDDRARDREGNLIPTVVEQCAEIAWRAAREQEKITAEQLREARVDLLLAQGAEMLERVIVDARAVGRHVDAWLAVDSVMWFELYFFPGSLEWAWSDMPEKTRFRRVQEGLAVPFRVDVYNGGSGARTLAHVILQFQDSTP